MAYLDVHPCPGGCGNHVPRNRLSCKPCWLRLPATLRAEITSSYAHVNDSTDGRHQHAQAIADASRWYRLNPRPPRHARN